MEHPAAAYGGNCRGSARLEQYYCKLWVLVPIERPDQIALSHSTPSLVACV